MGKKRHLKDLHRLGTEVVLRDDVSGDEYDDEGAVRVYVQKLTNLDTDVALKKANAARSRVLASYKNEESDEYRSLLDLTSDMGKDDLIEYLLTAEMARLEQVREAELAEDEDSEWAKDGYLAGLRQSWDEGLKDLYAKNPEEPEAKKVFDELKRFDDQLQKRLDRERTQKKDEYTQKSEDGLRQKVVQKMVDFQGDAAWVDEFKRCEIWLSVRKVDDHDQHYFEDRQEIDELYQPTIDELHDAYRDLVLGVLEGKDSRESQDSSPSSEPSEAVEASTNSGQQVVSV